MKCFCYQILVEVISPRFSTRPGVKVKSDNLPLLLVTWIDLVTSSIVLENFQNFSACSEIMTDQIPGIAFLNHNNQALRKLQS